MNAPFITALSATVPDTVPLSRWREMEAALRVSSRSGWDAWVALWRTEYGRHPGALAYAATHGPGIADESLPQATAIPVELNTDLSGLAVAAARPVCSARGVQAPPVDVVIFCHSSLNEHVSTTTAGRLRTVAGDSCFPFSISQQQGASFFTALRLAMDLLAAEPAVCTILLVAAEKWCPPFSRWATPWTLQGDAAGAVLIERAGAETHGLRLVSACTRALHPFAPSALLLSRDVNSIWAPAIQSITDSMLARHGLRPGDISAVVGHQVDQRLVAAISRHLGLPDTRRFTDRRAYLGAAESIVRLTETLGDPGLPLHGIVLAWGIGLGGYVGCALLESRGRPSLHRCANREDPL
jgi:3-oxoacyl-[acyl-carrier-protein] synthase III